MDRTPFINCSSTCRECRSPLSTKAAAKASFTSAAGTPATNRSFIRSKASESVAFPTSPISASGAVPMLPRIASSGCSQTRTTRYLNSTYSSAACTSRTCPVTPACACGRSRNTTLRTGNPWPHPRRHTLGQFQRLGPHRHNRKRPRLVRFQVRVHLFHGHRINGVLDFLKRAESAAHEIIVGDRAGPGAGGLALHDRAGLQACLGPFELGGCHALAQPMQFAQETVKRGLRPIVARAGIAQNAPLSFKTAIPGPNAVA